MGTRRACLSDAPACGLDLTHHSCIIHAPGAHPKQATNDRSSSLTPIVREECARCRDLSPRRDKIILSLITAPVPYRLSPLFSRGTGGAMRTPFFGEGNAPPTHKSGDRWPRSRSEIRSSCLYLSLTARPGGAHPPIQRWWPGLPQLGPGGVVAAPCQPPPPPAQAHPHLGIRCHRASRPTLHASGSLRCGPPALRRRLPGPRARLAESMQFNACGIIDTVHHVSVAFARHTSTGLSCGGGGLGLGYI